MNFSMGNAATRINMKTQKPFFTESCTFKIFTHSSLVQNPFQ